MKKDMKIIQLVCVSVVVIFLFIFMGVMILTDALSGEVVGFGRSNHGSHDLNEDPEGFWRNVLAWGGMFLFIAYTGIIGLIRAIKDIKNS